MPARQKLNVGYFNGSLIVAGLVGWAAQSWMVFVVVAAVLLIANVYCGEIRANRRKP